jgi:mRNA-degrading endonuclease HigB of HigAB toxin-antitoxin module
VREGGVDARTGLGRPAFVLQNVAYRTQIVVVKGIGTHAEYDRRSF